MAYEAFWFYHYKKGEEMTHVLGEDYLDHMGKKKKKKVSSKGDPDDVCASKLSVAGRHWG